MLVIKSKLLINELFHFKKFLHYVLIFALKQLIDIILFLKFRSLSTENLMHLWNLFAKLLLLFLLLQRLQVDLNSVTQEIEFFLS